MHYPKGKYRPPRACVKIAFRELVGVSTATNFKRWRVVQAALITAAIVLDFNLRTFVKAPLLASVAVFGLFGAAALASDLPTKAPVSKTQITAPPYNWSGFYVGANFGGGWTNGSLNITTLSENVRYWPLADMPAGSIGYGR